MFLRNAIFASLLVLLLVQVARPQAATNATNTATAPGTIPTSSSVTFGSSPPPAGELVTPTGGDSAAQAPSDAPARHLMPTFGYKTNQTNDVPANAAVPALSSGISLFFATLAGVAMLVVAL